MKLLRSAAFGVLCLSVLPTAAQASPSDWQGPVIVSFKASPLTVDVSKTSQVVAVEMTVMDEDGLRLPPTDTSESWGTVSGCGTIGFLKKVAQTATTVTLTGKLLVLQQSLPYSAQNPCRFVAITSAIDTIGNRPSNAANVREAFLEIINTTGPLPLGAFPTIPSDYGIEDALSPSEYKNYLATTKLMDMQDAALEKARLAKKISAKELATIPPRPVYRIGVGDLVVLTSFYRDAAIRSKMAGKYVVTINCVKGSKKQSITAVKAQCPAGWKRKF